MDTHIEFGTGKVCELVDILRRHDISPKLLVVSDPGVVHAGLVQPILDDLSTGGYACSLFTDVQPNPRDEDCMLGARLFATTGAAAVLAIGGGSAMDTAKAIALLAASGGTPAQYADGHLPYAAVHPVVCIPTTAGTGSEVTRSAVITESSTHRKMTLKHARLRPRLAVLDPQLTLTVPPSVTAATGVDALVHAIEGYTCTVSTPISKAFGQAAMPKIVAALPTAVSDGKNLHAREDMLLGSLLAGLCFGNADVAAVHCLAEALGGLYDTPHGVANAVFLPYVLRYNAEGEPRLHAKLARLMKFATEEDSDEEAVVKLVDGVTSWTRGLGIPTLRELKGVRREDFDRLVELAFANGSTPSNVRPIGKSEYRTILEDAWNDE